MAFAIGLRFYRLTIRRQGEKVALPIGPGGEPCDFIDYAADFVQRKTEPTVETATDRTWFFEPLETNSIRVVHGYINYGTHGFESKLKDVKTRKAKYQRLATDLEEIPLYFQIWSPSDADSALIAFQSFQGRSCVNYVLNAMTADFRKKYDGYLLLSKALTPDAAVLGGAPVKAVTFLKPKRVSDKFDRLLGKDVAELDYEVTVRAKRRGSMISTYKDLGQFVTPNNSGLVEFDGQQFEGAKADVKMGSKRRVIGIFGTGADAGLIEVSDKVKRDKSGHPTLESVITEVDSLMEEFYGSIKT